MDVVEFFGHMTCWAVVEETDLEHLSWHSAECMNGCGRFDGVVDSSCKCISAGVEHLRASELEHWSLMNPVGCWFVLSIVGEFGAQVTPAILWANRRYRCARRGCVVLSGLTDQNSDSPSI